MADNVLTKVRDWLGEAVKDVSELQVETYKANITATVSTSGKVSLDDLLDDLKVEVESGTLKLLMVSRGKIDHDAQIIYADDISEEDKSFVTQHKEMYEAAAKARSEVVDLAMRFAKDVIPG